MRLGWTVLVVALSSSFLLVECVRSFAGETDGSIKQTGAGSVYRTVSDTLQKRLRLAHEEELIPWADHPLVGNYEKPWRRYLQAALGLPKWFEIGVEQRTRYEHRSHPFRKGEFGTDRQVPQRTRVRLGLTGGPFRFMFEFEDSRTHNDGPGDFVDNSTVNKHDVQQLFVSIKSNDLFNAGLRGDLHVGRINMNFGHRRLIARNLFRNSTNAFDGVHVSVGRKNVWRVRGFLTFPVTRLEDEFDPVGPTNDQMFWGIQGAMEHLAWLKTNVYYFGLNDYRPGRNRRQYSTFGLRTYKPNQKGEFDYEGESALQVGTTGTNTGDKDHLAHMHHAELGYTFHVKWATRMVAQYDYASGTRNPNGSNSGTFDKLFGARNWELMPTGIFGPFFRSNISSPAGRVYVWPVPSVKLMAKYRAWWLAQSRDAWVSSGLQDPTGASGNFLGHDVELNAKWSPSPNLTFRAGYDHLFKGSYIKNLAKIPGNPSAKDTNYFYLYSELKF